MARTNHYSVSMKTKQNPSLPPGQLLYAAATSVVLGLAVNLQAQDTSIWTGNEDALWQESQNWDPASVPYFDQSGNETFIVLDGIQNQDQDIGNSTLWMQSLVFNNGGFSLGGGGDAELRLINANVQDRHISSSGDNSIDVPVFYTQGGVNWVESNNGTLTLNGDFSPAGQVRFRGDGDLVFNGAITGSNLRWDETSVGSITLNNNNNAFDGLSLRVSPNHSVILGADGAAGIGTISTTGGGGQLESAGGTRTLANNLSIGNTPLAFGGDHDFVINGNTNLSGPDNQDKELIVRPGIEVTLSGQISATADNPTFVKQGEGILVLEGDNTHEGSTRVEEGWLLVNNTQGSATGSGPVAVEESALLGGTGTIAGSVTLDGTIAPGESYGTLTLGSLDFGGNAQALFEIGSAPGGGLFDRVVLTDGGVSFDGDLLVFFDQNYGIQSWELFDFGLELSSGDFVSVIDVNEVYGSQNLFFDPSTGILTAIPEPGVFALLALSLSMVAFRRATHSQNT